MYNKYLKGRKPPRYFRKSGNTGVKSQYDGALKCNAGKVIFDSYKYEISDLQGRIFCNLFFTRSIFYESERVKVKFARVIFNREYIREVVVIKMS